MLSRLRHCVRSIALERQEDAEKHGSPDIKLPGAKAEPIFQRLTVCLKSYPDTNREFLRSLRRMEVSNKERRW
jgi:hypothetical protein